ncbi:MAG: hypothetical protein ABIK95_03335, partial [Acidobacteriota bacterium]
LNGQIQKRLNLQRGSFTALAYGLDHLWAADAQTNKILMLDPETGEIKSSFSNPGIQVNGLTFDGSSFWASDASTLSIYQVTPDGAVIRSFLSPGQSPRGLAYDGFYLWNADGSRKLFQMKVGG